MKYLLLIFIVLITCNACGEKTAPIKLSSIDLFTSPQEYSGKEIVIKGYFKIDKKNGPFLFHSKPDGQTEKATVSFFLDETSATLEVRKNFSDSTFWEHNVEVIGEIEFDESNRKITIVKVYKLEKYFNDGRPNYFDEVKAFNSEQ